MTTPLTRRRFIAVSAAAAGTALVPGGAMARVQPVRWRGIAMGAAASLDLAHPDRAAAEKAIAAAVAEVRRLEAVFSLYRADSSLGRLNTHGSLDLPPLDLVRCLSDAGLYANLTDGAFDPTVQPLWSLYSQHFAKPGANSEGPAQSDIARAKSLVDYRALSVTPERIGLGKPGMTVTSNGVAQGYITDRITELLRTHGFGDVLVNMGEIRGTGHKANDAPWTVGVHTQNSLQRVTLKDKAIATSAGHGTRFEQSGRFHHLFDPGTGASADRWSSISVVADTATEADALSTGFSAMEADAIERVAKQTGVAVLAVDTDGRTVIDGLHRPSMT